MANLAHGAAARARGTAERLAAWSRRAGEGLLSRLPSGVQQRIRSTIRVAFAVRAKAVGDNLGTQAAALTFTAFLALLPLVLLALSVLGFAAPQAQGLVLDPAGRTADPGTGCVRQRPARHARGRAPATGTARSRRRAVERLGALRPRGEGARRGVRVARVGGRRPAARDRRDGPLGVLFVLTLVAERPRRRVRLDGPLSGLTWIVTFALLTVVGFGFFLAGYQVLTPGGPMGLRDHVPGAVLMAVGWQLLLTIGTVFFSRSIARAAAVYGAVASLFGMLAFLRLAMSVWLYGAELSAVRFGERHPASSGAPESDPSLD